jgi:hypothetical protein
MNNMEFLEATIILIILASVFSVWTRMKERKEIERIVEGEFSAEDFKIIEI